MNSSVLSLLQSSFIQNKMWARLQKAMFGFITSFYYEEYCHYWSNKVNSTPRAPPGLPGMVLPAGHLENSRWPLAVNHFESDEWPPSEIVCLSHLWCPVNWSLRLTRPLVSKIPLLTHSSIPLLKIQDDRQPSSIWPPNELRAYQCRESVEKLPNMRSNSEWDYKMQSYNSELLPIRNATHILWKWKFYSQMN